MSEIMDMGERQRELDEASRQTKWHPASGGKPPKLEAKKDGSQTLEAQSSNSTDEGASNVIDLRPSKPTEND